MNATIDSKAGLADIEHTNQAPGPEDLGQDLDEAGAAFEGYRELCGLAVGTALALALTCPLALVHPTFWAIPIVTVLLARGALRRIRDVPQQTGRTLALLAIAIALTFAAAAPLQPYLYDFAMRAQAVGMAREWFLQLRQNKPAEAFELTAAKWLRRSEAISVAEYHRRMEPSGVLRPYVDQPPVKLLLSLGGSSHVRFYKHLSIVTDSLAETDRVEDVYAVTGGEGEAARPAFIKLTLTRRLDLMRRVRSWEVSKAEMVDDQGVPSQKAGAGDRIGRS